MNKNKSLTVTCLAFVLLTAAGSANPVHAMEPYWYAAAGYGEAETSASGFEDPTTVSLHIGNRVNPSTAVEFGYVDLDQFDATRLSNSYIEISGIDISVLSLVPIGGTADVFARVGLYLWQLDAVRLGSKFAEEEDDSLLFGLGANLALGDTLGARLEWTKYFEIEGENVYTLSLGLYVNF